MASLFPGTSKTHPLILDALIITHGNADHFSGLVELARAVDHKIEKKRIHVYIARYFHNGLVKPPEKILENGKERYRKEKEKLGDFKKIGGKIYVTSILDDPRNVPEVNIPFSDWNKALNEMLLDPSAHEAPALSGEILPRIKRLVFGQHDAFDLFREAGVDFQVLGPLVEEIDGAPALEFLKGDSGISASHTINGHSVVLRMRFGNIRFLLGGDLNIHSQERLIKQVNETEGIHLRSEILKVPHHGSHEFNYHFLEKVSPVVSVVSSGDENAMKEYVHPRANLMAALGLCSRKPRPLVFSTELAAFFAYRGPVQPEQHCDDGKGGLKDIPKSKRRGMIHAFQRLIFGAVRVHTDGRRVLVAVESANDGIKEAYAFFVDEEGEVTTDNVNIF